MLESSLDAIRTRGLIRIGVAHSVGACSQGQDEPKASTYPGPPATHHPAHTILLAQVRKRRAQRSAGDVDECRSGSHPFLLPLEWHLSTFHPAAEEPRARRYERAASLLPQFPLGNGMLMPSFCSNSRTC